MTERQYKTDIIKKMKAIGTYNEAFIHTIDVLAKIMVDYEEARALHISTGQKLVIPHTNKNGSTNLTKNPIYAAIEKMRDDIIAYSRELGLTPAGLKRINEKGMTAPKVSKLEEILRRGP